MIITHGDVLNTNIHIIAHQVNCKGVMGGGLAKQIKDMYPSVYDDYKEAIQDYWDCNGESPLGTGLACYFKNREIWNVFGQEDYGKDKCYTNYQAVEDGFYDLILSYRESNGISILAQIPIAIPCYFGCGLGGGDWDIMKQSLERIERTHNVIFVAYKYS